MYILSLVIQKLPRIKKYLVSGSCLLLCGLLSCPLPSLAKFLCGFFSIPFISCRYFFTTFILVTVYAFLIKVLVHLFVDLSLDTRLACHESSPLGHAHLRPGDGRRVILAWY